MFPAVTLSDPVKVAVVKIGDVLTVAAGVPKLVVAGPLLPVTDQVPASVPGATELERSEV